MLAPASQMLAEDWPLFRGDLLGTGESHDALPDELAVLWKFAPTGAVWDSTAVIVGERVYVGSLEGTFYCLNLATGEPIWKMKTELGFSAPAGVRDGKVFVGDADGMFYCLNAENGDVLWKLETQAEINSAPGFYQDRVLFGSQDATLYCVPIASGDITKGWKFAASDQIRCTPTIVENRCFVAGCDSKLHVIDVDNGREVAAVEIGSPTGCAPAIRGDYVYFGTEGGTFQAINWRTAQSHWSVDSPKGQPYRSSAALGKKAVIVGGRDKLLRALSFDKGEEAWSFPTRGKIDSSPVICGERVFFGSSDGRIYALRLDDGKEAWRYEMGGDVVASPAIASGRLVIGSSRGGTLVCFGKKPENPVERN
jgi:outer membrane protein assembly factor BamB